MWGRLILGAAALLIGGAIIKGATGQTSARPPRVDPRLRRRVHAQLSRAVELLEADSVPPLVERGTGNAAGSSTTVFYNPVWVQRQLEALCDDAACQDALLLGLMAHELAHVELDHMCVAGDVAHEHREELVADEWAGRALARAGVSREHFERLLKSFGEVCTPSHPPASARIERLREAYEVELAAST